MVSDSLQTDSLILIYDVARLMRTRADRLARQHGMTRAQWVILAWLENKPGLAQIELAELVEVEPITIARLIDRLETHGLVERRADAKDRRIRRLFLRDKALPVLEEIKAYRRQLSEVMSQGLSPDQATAATQALLQMKTNLTQDLNQAKVE
jgi:DNA-binding MarR family transcriptional regulator